MAKSIIITAADALYTPLAQDLFASIRALKFDVAFDIGMLDVGLTTEQHQAFTAQGIKVVQAVSDIEYPNREQWETKRPGVRTLTARPFLRRYFPGYDVYMWLDSDIWVQTPDAINIMLTGAANSPAIHMACELDRCYTTFFRSAEQWSIFNSWYAANYDAQTVSEMAYKPMLNAGVFAMRRDAPHWDAWADIYAGVLQRTTGLDDKTFMADQLALNILAYRHHFPHVVMPASFNWLTYYALPKIDGAGQYVEPLPPHRPISQFHLTRPNKAQVEKLECLDGRIVERTLLFSAKK